MKIPLEDTREKKVKLLTELNDRECVVRIENNSILIPAFKATTLDFFPIPRILNSTETYSNFEREKGKKKGISFKINTNVCLKDILLKNSTSKKEDLENE